MEDGKWEPNPRNMPTTGDGQLVGVNPLFFIGHISGGSRSGPNDDDGCGGDTEELVEELTLWFIDLTCLRVS